ncbi:23S rRNA (adenine(1618)-N(6))-methyltransferase RlmF [uncultured Flavobacterium sp.]|uniref:23S rRNA (adenine(1618)-N(6))-methyltransferase RlmF n=1 Tax=uncultured Flavobacterium sp. TaxID=165435 RepID=UPI0030C898DA
MNITPQKKGFHQRNKHNVAYDFEKLISTTPTLKEFISINKFGNESIDFSNSKAVKTLNTALLKTYYNIKYWDIPQGFLCPPIPGRAEYIHHIADVLSEVYGEIPTGKKIKILDIGTGSNLIYPIIGVNEYGWQFVGSEIDSQSIKWADKIVKSNISLKDLIELRIQSSKRNIFKNIIKEGEYFDMTLCNPPFHSSKAEATKGTIRKVKNLKNEITSKPTLNFGGVNNELWCEGGELAFITNMIYESVHFKTQSLWFSTLVSKKENLKPIYNLLKKVGAVEVKTINQEQGNKISRLVFWSFKELNNKIHS